jgi:hypothetical protein
MKSGMKSEEARKASFVSGTDTVATAISLEEVVANLAPIGTFADTNDFLVRIQNGKPIAANTGAQGGGQN